MHGTHENYIAPPTTQQMPMPNPALVDINNPNLYMFPNIVNDVYNNPQNQIPQSSQIIHDKYRKLQSSSSSSSTSWYPYNVTPHNHYSTNHNSNSKLPSNTSSFPPYVDENNYNRTYSSIQGPPLPQQFSGTTANTTSTHGPPSPYYNSRRPPPPPMQVPHPSSTHMSHNTHPSYVPHMLPTNVVRSNNNTSMQSPQYDYFDPQQQ